MARGATIGGPPRGRVAVRAGAPVHGPGVGTPRGVAQADDRRPRAHRRPGVLRHVLRPDPAEGRPDAGRRCRGGAEVQLCFGAPDSDAVATRDREEELGGTLAHKIRSALTYYRPLVGVEGCELRLHSTTLYASLFRYDDEIMVNPHAYGQPASANPTLHLRRLDGGQLVDHYIACFKRVWETAKPWNGEEV